MTTRPISISWGGLSRADGSAKFAFGNTGAIASVSGPIEVRLAAELPSRAALEILVRPLTGVPGTAEKTFARRLGQILEEVLLLNHFPRTLVQLVLQSLSSAPTHVNQLSSNVIHASQAAVLINAASLALLHASSVPMRGVVAAVALGKRRDSGAISLDPEPERDEYERLGYFAFLFTEGRAGQVIWADWQGDFDESEYARVVDLARKGAQGVLEVIRGDMSGEAVSAMDVS